jgi:hypothetical protein
MNTDDEQNNSVFSLFKEGLKEFSKNKDNYNLDEFIQSVFFVHISVIAHHLPEWFTILIKSGETNIINIYDFCNSIVNELYVSFLDTYKNGINNLPDNHSLDDEYKEFEAFCVFGLLLYNATYLFNKTVEKNIKILKKLVIKFLYQQLVMYVNKKKKILLQTYNMY